VILSTRFVLYLRDATIEESNNILCVRYVHLTKAKQSLFIRDKAILESEKSHKDYDRKGAVEKISGRDFQGA
jgi:hypothetical protein